LRRLHDEVPDAARSGCALDLIQEPRHVRRAVAGNQRPTSDVADRTEWPKSLQHDLCAADEAIALAQDDPARFQAEQALGLHPDVGLDEVPTWRCHNELVPRIGFRQLGCQAGRSRCTITACQPFMNAERQCSSQVDRL
jgi:hypothetical protein